METTMTANTSLPTDHNAQPEQFLRNDAVRDALPPDVIAINMETVMRICVRYDCSMTHTDNELVCENCGSATVPEDAPQVGGCLLCHCGIFEIDDAPTCHNGCDAILGRRRSCPTCTAAVPLTFNFCPSCGFYMDGAPFFDGDPVATNRGDF